MQVKITITDPRLISFLNSKENKSQAIREILLASIANPDAIIHQRLEMIRVLREQAEKRYDRETIDYWERKL